MLISSDEARSLLEFIEHKLSACITSGCSAYFSLLHHVPYAIKARATANLIYDFIEAHARSIFEAVPGVKILDHNGLFLLLVKDKLVVRFKKFNSEKLPSYIPTNQATDYIKQDFELPNYPKHALLIVGYELDSLKAGLREITVTCPNGDNNLWSFNLGGTIGMEIVELPIPMSATPDIPMRPIIQTEERRKKKLSNE